MSVAVCDQKTVTLDGTNECEYADEPIKEIKKMLGIQQRIEEEETNIK